MPGDRESAVPSCFAIRQWTAAPAAAMAFPSQQRPENVGCHVRQAKHQRQTCRSHEQVKPIPMPAMVRVVQIMVSPAIQRPATSMASKRKSGQISIFLAGRTSTVPGVATKGISSVCTGTSRCKENAAWHGQAQAQNPHARRAFYAIPEIGRNGTAMFRAVWRHGYFRRAGNRTGNTRIISAGW